MKPADGAHRGVKWSRGGTRARLAPSVFQYDFLVLRLLQKDIRQALASVGRIESEDAVAVDIGGGDAPYRSLLEAAGYRVQCLDIAQSAGVDIVGSAEHTGLPDESVDLVLCTQVLEHTRAPWSAMREFARILRPGGVVLISAPHVWFFHPHPSDYWRMTSQGLRALCDEGGLDVVDLRAQGGSAAALFQVVNFLIFGVLGRAGAPLYAAMNGLGLVLDRLVLDRRFALNHSCLANKPASVRASGAARSCDEA